MLSYLLHIVVFLIKYMVKLTYFVISSYITYIFLLYYILH